MTMDTVAMVDIYTGHLTSNFLSVCVCSRVRTKDLLCVNARRIHSPHFNSIKRN